MCGLQVRQHQGKPWAQLWPPASSLKSWPMAGTTALGWAGREAQLAEVWKAEGKPPGRLHFGLGGRSPRRKGKM